MNNLQGLVKQSMQDSAQPAPGAPSEEEMLMRVLQASQQRQPNPAPSANPYAAGMQQQEGLSPNPFQGKVPANTQELLQRAMMEEMARQKGPAMAPASLPSQVKRPPGM